MLRAHVRLLALGGLSCIKLDILDADDPYRQCNEDHVCDADENQIACPSDCVWKDETGEGPAAAVCASCTRTTPSAPRTARPAAATRRARPARRSRARATARPAPTTRVSAGTAFAASPRRDGGHGRRPHERAELQGLAFPMERRGRQCGWTRSCAPLHPRSTASRTHEARPSGVGLSGHAVSPASRSHLPLHGTKEPQHGTAQSLR